MSPTEEAKLLHAVERHLFQDELRHLKTRQGAFDAAMYHLDHPVPGTDFYLKPSDHGRGAADIRRNCESSLDTQPLWRKMWPNAVAHLPPVGKRVLYALREDWRTRPAARIAGVDHKTVALWKNKFKIIFAQCFRAYKRDFGGKQLPAF